MTVPAPAAGIYGTYHDLRPIKTRKVVQLVIEIPVELAPRIVEAFGWPNAHTEEVWLAVARLKPEAVEAGSDRQSEPADPGTQTGLGPAPNTPEAAEDQGQASAKTGRPSHNTARSQECGRFCNDRNFQAFIRETKPALTRSHRDVAEIVRLVCQVESRRELDTDDGAWQRWRGLMSDYACWADTQKRKSMGEAGNV